MRITEISKEDLNNLLDYRPLTFQGRVELEEFLKDLMICGCTMNELWNAYKLSIPEVQKSIYEFKEEIGDEGRQMRLRYLNERLCELNSELQEIYRDYQRATRDDSPYIERALIAYPIPHLEKESKTLEREVNFIVKDSRETNGKITSEMIERAKEFPIENLIEVNRGKVALCPFHDDHNPSMSIKNNRFYCFGCSQKGDVIEFVMRRDGFSFREAVKFLNQ